MGTLISFWEKKKTAPVRHLENGAWYDLQPPVETKDGLVFRRARCQYQVPGRPNEYSLEGMPDGHTKMEGFILRFTDTGRVVAKKSANQSAP
ncbi:hypothetical protein HY406_01445 [Candidatus Giovannonibacteria bacterium]|nr:hypothetical protein [Candidatus Giovannonibacteria bacterium]